MHMAPPQHANVVWATEIVIKWLKVHHLLLLLLTPSSWLGIFHFLVHSLKLLHKLLLLHLLHVHVIYHILLPRLMLDIITTSSSTPTPRRNNTFLLQTLETLSLLREACLAFLTRRVLEDEPSVTCTQHNQHKTVQNRRSKPILGVSRINFPDNEFRIGSVQRKKICNKLLACIQKSN